MEAEKKLQGAEYHLQRMEEFYLKNEEIFTYELEAFLAKIRSVLDVLLEDFNRKFSLGVGLEVKLKANIFEKRAKQLNNIQALNFIRWWRRKRDAIYSSPLGFLFLKRNVSVHRAVVKPNLKKVTASEMLTVSESITVVKYNEKGRLVEKWEGPKPSPVSRDRTSVEINWFFKDYRDKNVLEVCRELFKLMEDIVKEAKTLFN